MFRFSSYYALIFLILIPYAFYISKKSLADLTSWRRWSTFGVRSIIIILLVLSLSGFKLVWKVDRLCVIFALDVSNSISPTEIQGALGLIGKIIKSMREDDEAGLIVFGKEAYVELPPRANVGEITRMSSTPSREYTNLSSAIKTAVDLFPTAVLKKIVLMTDGNENVDSVLDSAGAIAKASEVRVFTIPLSTRGEGKKEVLIEGLIGPGRINIGRRFELKAIVKSTVDGTAILKLFKDKSYLVEKRVELSSKGKNVFVFPQVLDSEGTHVYEVSVESPSDTIRENNQASTVVIASGKPKVLYLTDDPDRGRHLQSALSQKDIEIKLLTDPSMMPPSLLEVQNYNAIIFDNIPAHALSKAQMDMIESYVHDLGGGFVMIGGENSFGSGGYSDTPIEKILPVKMIPERKKRSLSIVLAIDRSGSMADPSGRFAKIDLAKEAAMSVIELLKDKDQLGVIAFDAKEEEIVRLEQVRSKEEIVKSIATIRARGGTNMYPALNMAYDRLKKADTQLKHVLIVSDGRSLQSEESYALVKKMAGDSITVSTIAIGDDADKKLMKDMADAGAGRHYETKDAGDLPRIFLKETFLAGGLIIEGDFRPIVSGYSEILKGIETLPRLRGYVGTSPKEGASVLVTSDQGDPILSAWQYGLGRTLAFTSDARPKWAVEWIRWGKFSKFWSQVVGWCLATPSGEFDVSASISGGRGHIVVDAVSALGQFRNFLNFKASVVKPDLSREEISLRQSGPGRYEAEFDTVTPGAYLLSVSEMKDGEAEHSQSASVIASYSPEYKDLEPNHPLLKTLADATGGKFNPEVGDIVLHEPTDVWQLRDIRQALLSAVIPLFFLDVALRRITLSREQVSKLRAKLRLLKRKEIAPTEITALLALKQRKEKIIDVQKVREIRTERDSTSHLTRLSVESSETYTSRLLEAKRRALQNKA